MTKPLIVLTLLAILAAAQYSGYLIGYVEYYEDQNGDLVRSEVNVFLQLDNGTLLKVDKYPWSLIGTGERVTVKGRIESGLVRVEEISPTQAPSLPPKRPVTGSLQVTLVAVKWSDVGSIPYNYSYLHDLVFGLAPSVRDYYETLSNLLVLVKPYYIEPRWIDISMSTSDFCQASGRFTLVARRAIEYLYYNRGVKLLNFSYLVLVFNAQPPCEQDISGRASLRYWRVSTPYGTLYLGIAWVYRAHHVASGAPNVRFFVATMGQNLGLYRSGTVYDEYDDPWDPMGRGRVLYRWPRGVFFSPYGLNVYHRYYLGWASLTRLLGGGVLEHGRGVMLNERDPYLIADYRCRVNAYDSALPFCGVVFYRVNSQDVEQWIYFINFTSPTDDSFLDVGEVVNIGRAAGLGDLEVAVIWRNTERAYIVTGRPSLRDVLLYSNASFVVGERAPSIASLGSAVLSGRLTPVLYLQQYNWTVQTYSAFLDSEFLSGNVPTQRRTARHVVLPSVVVSVGGPLANRLTGLLNPPDRIGQDGLPFFYDTSVGGIRDVQTGRVWTRDAAVVATAVHQGRVYLLVWGLTSRDTYLASAWVRDCLPNSPTVRGVVINTVTREILASWPPGMTSYSCRPKAFSEVVVLGERASAAATVGAAMIGAGNAVLDTWGVNGTYVFSVGGPFANSFTRRYNPPDRVGYGGLPFYYDTSAGGIRDARFGVLYRGNVGVIASLYDGGRRVILAWGITGEDTRIMAAIVAQKKDFWKSIRGNYAEVIRWSVVDGRIEYNILTSWCDCEFDLK